MRLASVLSAVCAALAFTLAAADPGAVEVTGMWARATPPTATMGAAYMNIKSAKGADKLLGATTSAAERVEIHTTTDNNGVMQMRPLKEVAIAPGKTASLSPSGTHLMLVGLKAPLKEGETFPLKLRFEQAGELTVLVGIFKAAPMTGQTDH